MVKMTHSGAEAFAQSQKETDSNDDNGSDQQSRCTITQRPTFKINRSRRSTLFQKTIVISEDDIPPQMDEAGNPVLPALDPNCAWYQCDATIMAMR
jgi:hypothetical protein